MSAVQQYSTDAGQRYDAAMRRLSDLADARQKFTTEMYQRSMKEMDDYKRKQREKEDRMKWEGPLMKGLSGAVMGGLVGGPMGALAGGAGGLIAGAAMPDMSQEAFNGMAMPIAMRYGQMGANGAPVAGGAPAGPSLQQAVSQGDGSSNPYALNTKPIMSSPQPQWPTQDFYGA